MATETAVRDGVGSITGDLKMLAQNQGDNISLPTSRVQVEAGDIQLLIEDITTTGWSGPNPQPEVGHTYTVAVFIASGHLTHAGVEDHEFIYFDLPGNMGGFPPTAIPWNVVRDFNFSISGRQLLRTETTTPGTGRDASPVYAAEVDEVDVWTGLIPVGYTVSFGDLSWSGTNPNPGMAPPIAISSVGFQVIQHKGLIGVQYADLVLDWAGVDCDFSRYVKDLGDWHFEGVSDGIEVWMDKNNAGLNDSHTATVYRPYIYDFGEYYLPDMDGNDTAGDGLRVDGPFQASNHYSASLDWSTTP